MAQEDREQLATYLLHLQAFVPRGAERHLDELPETLGQDLLQAWSRQKPNFDFAVTYLRGEQDPEMRQVLDVRLQELGLTDRDLAIKLEVYYVTVRIYEEHPTPSRFGDALEAGDVLLESLGKTVPYLDPISEIKKLFEFLFKFGRGPIRRAWRRLRGR